ncbi:MAG: DUF5777 family beta-barrel protein [Bacteroidota bacterium]|jgi:hypothetical protein
MKKLNLLTLIVLLGFVKIKSQSDSTDLLSLIDQSPVRDYTIATFKGTRLVNFHTVEVLGKRCLDFRIAHRFGELNTGAYNAFGIDGGANIRIGLEYSHDGRLMFGAGRTSSQKIVDGFLKYKLLRQTTDNKMPITLTLFSSVFYTFEKKKIGNFDYYNNVTDRMSYCNQIMIGRKFNSKFSIQLIGGMVHFNLVENFTDKNDCYFAGVVSRYKITSRQAITLEYAARLNKYSLDKYYDSFAIGYDLETGGHVFQVHLTNSFALTENQFYMYTRTSWSDWGIRLGFNISRVFAIGSGGY